MQFLDVMDRYSLLSVYHQSPISVYICYFFCDFQIIFILFCVIRRLVWDYGRLALIQKEDQG